MNDNDIVPINFRGTRRMRRLIKEEAARRGMSVKEVGIKLFDAWLKVKDAK